MILKRYLFFCLWIWSLDIGNWMWILAFGDWMWDLDLDLAINEKLCESLRSILLCWQSNSWKETYMCGSLVWPLVLLICIQVYFCLCLSDADTRLRLRHFGHFHLHSTILPVPLWFCHLGFIYLCSATYPALQCLPLPAAPVINTQYDVLLYLRVHEKSK